MKERSFSLRTAQAFLESYRQSHPGDAVRTVDVFDGALPEFGVLQVAAKYKILHGKPSSPGEAAAWKCVEGCIADFRAADKYVISSAMWNFGLPYMLKKYIDILVQPGYTFTYSPAAGYKGLVTGRPAMLILARGGAYGEGTGAEAYDLQKPYLETILRFIGFTRIETILVEPTLMGGQEAAAEKLAAAAALAREKARSF
jgi:FMN-dependent NADH-azoreductase